MSFLDLSSEEMLVQKPSKENATLLQQNVEKLHAFVAAGLDQLRIPSHVDAVITEKKTPPLLFWILAVSSGSDSGAYFRGQLAARSTVCGHYFKSKEMVVSCSDCAADSTCVMCMACFQLSPCREHNYKIHMSGGGGMCDCGDPTAYKPESFCPRHAGTSTTADPLTHISTADLLWMTEVFQGAVKALALVVARVDVKGSSPEEKKKKKKEQTPKEDSDCLKSLFNIVDLVSKYLIEWANAGDAGKRLLGNALLEKITCTRLGEEREETRSCLECFFLSTIYNSNLATKLGAVFAVCLSDPLFRTPFAAMMLKYREYMCGEKDTEFDQENLSVQVFTNADVVRALMTEPATYSTYTPTCDTIAHRLVMGIYVLLNFLERPLEEDTSHPETVAGIPFQIKMRETNYNHDILNDIQHILMTSPESAIALFTSRTAYRGLLESFKVISASSAIAENQPVGGRHIPVPFFLYYVFSRCLLILQRSVRSVITALDSIPPNTEHYTEDLSKALQVSPQLLRTLAQSTHFDTTPFLTDEAQSARIRSRVAAFIEATCVQDAKEALLLPDTVASGRASSEFVHALLDEAIQEMQPLMKQQVEILTHHNKALVLSCKEGSGRFSNDVYMYDGGSPCMHRVLMSNVLTRWVAIVARAWMCSQDGIEPSRLYGMEGGGEQQSELAIAGDHESAELAPKLLENETRRPLLNMIKSSFTPQQEPSFIGFLFDTLVMPSVFCSRISIGLMRAEEEAMLLVELMYLRQRRQCGYANDIYLLQLLTLVMRPQDFAVRLLQRFSFSRNPTTETEAQKKKKLKKKKKREGNASGVDAARRIPPGLPFFFRLLLTIVLDNSKLSTDDDFSIAALTREVTMTLVAGALPYSSVEEEMNDASSESNKRKEQMDVKLPQVLKDVAVREKTGKGFVFKIKSVEMWEQEVNLYHTSVCDVRYNAIYDSYKQIYMAEQRGKKAKVDPANDVAAVPPPVLRTKQTYAELIPSTRALLHTDAVLLPAMFVVHQYMENVTKGTAEKKEEGSDSDEENDTTVTEVLLVHALSALYVCAKDCEEIAAEFERQRVNERIEEGGQDAPTGSGSVNWDFLESFFENQSQSACSYTMESYASLLLCPAALVGGTLRSKLAREVQFTPGEKATSIGDTLHALRDHIKRRKELNRFSLLLMIEKILLITGLAQFQSAELTTAERASEQEAQSHRQKLKEKQEMILKRMRMRTKNAGKDLATEGVDDGNTSTTVAATKDANAAGFLHTRMLMDLAAQECSVCRVARDEPLFLLANTSTSGVLERLQPLFLPDKRKVHGHFYVCGHAAHASCVRKVISSAMRSGYRGRAYLGVSEISCPVCMMVSNALSPLPALTSAKGVSSSASLLEDIQDNNLNGSQGAQKVYKEEVENLHVALANANIGLSLFQVGDAIEKNEDALQKNNNKAWILSESIRMVWYHINLVMERVKMGKPVHERDLLAELSLLTSFSCDRLRAEAKPLRENFVRTHEEISILLLDCLLEPAKASEKIRVLMLQWIQSVDQVRTYLTALVDSLAAAAGDDAVPPDASHPMLKNLWQQLGALTLLKVLLCDVPAGAVLELRGDEVCFPPLEEASLSAEATRASAIVRMLHYLTTAAGAPRGSTNAEMVEALRKALADSAAVSLDMPLGGRLQLPAASFDHPSSWREHLARDVLHLPQVYTTLLTHYAEVEMCSICSKVSKNPFMCCLCGAFMCFGEGELHEHARVCSGGSAVFIDIHYTVFRIVNAVDEKVTLLSPAYVDVHGETDMMLRRGQRLSLDPDECQQLLYFWLGNRWGVQSQCVKQTVRYLRERI